MLMKHVKLSVMRDRLHSSATIITLIKSTKGHTEIDK
jgi:hypothetical protein